MKNNNLQASHLESTSMDIHFAEFVMHLQNHPNWNKILDIIKTELPILGVPKYGHEKERAHLISDLLKIPLLDYGSCRAVLDLSEFVIKIPLQPEGIEENKQEILLWTSMPTEAKKFFTPYLGGHATCAIFKKVSSIESLITIVGEDCYKSEISSIVNQLTTLGVIIDDCTDERYDQWGLLEEQLVIADYGLCKLHDSINKAK